MLGPKRVLAVVVAVGALAVWLGGVGSSAHSAPRAGVAASKTPFKALTTWVLIPTKGMTTVGKGTFSAKLGKAAALVAYAYQALTGVPLADIAEGGRFVLSENFGSTGLQTGTIVLKYKNGTLGEACASYTAHHVGSVTSTGYVRDIGSLHTTGGTGSAARWHASLSFGLTGISGTNVEQLSYTGNVTASLGSARKPTAACRALAKLL